MIADTDVKLQFIEIEDLEDYRTMKYEATDKLMYYVASRFGRYLTNSSLLFELGADESGPSKSTV